MNNNNDFNNLRAVAKWNKQTNKQNSSYNWILCESWRDFLEVLGNSAQDQIKLMDRNDDKNSTRLVASGWMKWKLKAFISFFSLLDS